MPVNMFRSNTNVATVHADRDESCPNIDRMYPDRCEIVIRRRRDFNDGRFWLGSLLWRS